MYYNMKSDGQSDEWGGHCGLRVQLDSKHLYFNSDFFQSHTTPFTSQSGHNSSVYYDYMEKKFFFKGVKV